MTRPARAHANAEHSRERLLADVHVLAEGGGGFVAAALLAIAMFLTLGAYSAYQVSSRDRAHDLLGAGIASTTELDLLLAEALPVLREQAQTEPASSYGLPGYPLAVEITHEELTERDNGELHSLVLSRSVDKVYDEGLTAFDTNGTQDLGFLSVGDMVEQVVGQITAENHRQAGWIAVVLAIFCAIASVTVVVLYEGFRGFRALGLAFVFGASPGFLLAVLASFAIGRTIGSDPYSQDLEAIMDAILNVGRRNYLIVALLGLLVAVMGPLLSFVADRIGGDADSAHTFVQMQAYQDDWDGYDDGHPYQWDEFEDDDPPAAYDPGEYGDQGRPFR